MNQHRLTDYIQNFNRTFPSGKFPEFMEFPKHGPIAFDDNEPMWDTPLVGYAAGTDHLFQYFKEDFGVFYRTPLEWFETAYGTGSSTADKLCVMSIVMPQTAQTKRDQRIQTDYPAARWVLTRTMGHEYLRTMIRQVTQWLHKHDIRAVAPMVHPDIKTFDQDKYTLCCNWSERHTAYICGLGTFGLSAGLITSVGKAVRIASIIMEADFNPSKRPYSHHNEYCLFYSKGACSACIDRCPAGAITCDGHNKTVCRAYQEDIVFPHMKEQLGFQPYGCGLCQSGVPCEHGIPKSLLGS